VRTDDSFVKNVEFLTIDEKGAQGAVKEGEKIYEQLVAHEHRKFYIKINDNVHEIPTVGGSDLGGEHKCDIETDRWYDRCLEQGLSTTHASTLATFIHQFEKTMGDGLHQQ
jgi:hypothetical protein